MSVADTIDVALRAQIDQYMREMKKADDITDKTTKSIEKKFKNLGSTISKLTGGLTIASIMVGAVKAFSEAEQGAIKLDSVLSSMGRGAGLLSVELKNLAGQIQSEGIISDDEIIRGQTMLATFDTISNEALPRATRVMADFAAMTGGDARTAAMLLGRASAGMTETLARYGIILPDSVKKSGDFNLILAEIEKKIGGMNKALGDSASGAIPKFMNVLNDLAEVLGSRLTFAISEFLTTDQDLKSWSEGVAKYLDIAADSIEYVINRFKIGVLTIKTGVEQTYALLTADLEKVKKLGGEYEKALDELIYEPRFSDRRKRYEVETEVKVRTKKTEENFKARNIKQEADALSDLNFQQARQNEALDYHLAQLDEYEKKMFDTREALKDAADPTRELTRSLELIDEALGGSEANFEAWSEAVIAAHDKADAAIKKLSNTAAESTDEMSKFFERAMENMQDAFSGLLEDVFMGKAVDFEKEFKALLARMAAQLAASKILELLMGTKGADGKYSGGLASSIGSGVGNWVGGLFSGAAMGGEVSAGVPREVGERGREVFIPKTDGTIVSHEQLARGGGRGAVSVTNVFNISTGVAQTVRAELQAMAPQIEERSKQGVLAAIERGGSYAKAVNRRS